MSKLIPGFNFRRRKALDAPGIDWFHVASGAISKPLGMRYLFTWSAVLFIFVFAAGTLAVITFPLTPRQAVIFSVLIVITALIIQYCRYGPEISGPLLLFALTMFVFIWARPLIALSSQEFDLHYIAVLSGISVSNTELAVYYSCLVASMLAFSATVLSLQLPRATGIVHSNNITPFTRQYLTSWQIIFWTGGLASAVQSSLYVRYFLGGGSYYDLYVLGRNAVGFPALSFMASLMFYGYIGLLLASRDTGEIPAHRRRRLWTSTFVILTLLTLAQGSRGAAFTELLSAVWLNAFTGGTRLRIRTWVIVGSGLFFLTQLVSALRSGSSTLFDSKTMKAITLWFLYTQGLSGELVAPASSQFGVGVRNLKFIFSPLLTPFRVLIDPSFGQQTAQSGQSSGLLAQELAYRLAPNLYLAGHGAGSSYVVETYCALGIIGVFLATVLLTWIVARGPYLAGHSPSALFIFSASLPFILFTPRESLVYSVVPALKAALILFGCLKLRKALCLLR